MEEKKKVKRIESDDFINLLTHLITNNSEKSFNSLWDFYFGRYDEKYKIGLMNQNELKKWLLEEVDK